MQSDVQIRFEKNPSRLREELSDHSLSQPVIIDEIQKVPSLLDEVHWLIEHQKIQFILCGSSARKLIRLGSNLLAIVVSNDPVMRQLFINEKLTVTIYPWADFLSVLWEENII